jgi:hypothetical protein
MPPWQMKTGGNPYKLKHPSRSFTSSRTPSVFCLQVVDCLCQRSQRTWLDGVPSLLEVHDCGLGNSGLAREMLRVKLLRFCPDLIEIFCVD